MEPNAPFPTNPFPEIPPKPKNWLVESILITLFCCLILGIIGIVNATKVDSLYNAGDYAGAEKASQTAGQMVKIGFFVGIGILVLNIIYYVAIKR